MSLQGICDILTNKCTHQILSRIQYLVTPSDLEERRGLARRRMMRTLAPWILENPIFFHMTNSSFSAIKYVKEKTQR